MVIPKRKSSTQTTEQKSLAYSWPRTYKNKEILHTKKSLKISLTQSIDHTKITCSNTKESLKVSLTHGLDHTSFPCISFDRDDTMEHVESRDAITLFPNVQHHVDLSGHL